MDMDRRAFSALLPALLAPGTLLPQSTAQTQQPAQMPTTTRTHRPLERLSSGVYEPGAAHAGQPGHASSSYLAGLLITGNIQLEIHQSTQQPGAIHETVDKHLHNEIWLVKEGACDLTINGVTKRMVAGDVGLVAAGDNHYIAVAGDTPCTYFVVTVGPPE